MKLLEIEQKHPYGSTDQPKDRGDQPAFSAGLIAETARDEDYGTRPSLKCKFTPAFTTSIVSEDLLRN
jgi:hypothetical protein